MDPNGLLSMSLELNVARKCRICGMDIHDLTCAFPIFGSDRLDAKIQRYLQLNITRDDLLPKCVCGSCYLKLESIDQFAVMANRTDDAFRAWISRLRGLNSPEEAGRSVNVALPLYRPQHQQPNAPSQAVDDKGSIILQPQPTNVTRPRPKGNIAQPGTPASSPSVVSYSDLKLGLLIKDQELLKLILKALKWAENDRRASFDVLIQRLKNSSFREVLSNHNLLNDSDLTQLLKSYIGQGVMSSFLPMPATSGNQYVLNNNVPPPLVPLQPAIAQPMNEDFVGLQRIKLPQSTPKPGGATGVPDLQIDEASVTQMEVGVDPDLYFPYEDEDSSSTTKYEITKVEDRQENTVTIKLMSTNVAGDLVENKRMIPAILNVRGSNRFQCSACPECFPTNPDLQQHIVTSHLSKGNRTVPTEQGKPAIKIRVRKNKPAVIMVPKPVIAPPPPVVIMTSTESSRAVPVTLPPPAVLHQSAPSISIAPLKIPASTTITMVPGPVKTEPDPTSVTQPETASVSAAPSQKTTIKESPRKVGLVRKSKRKLSIKLEFSPHTEPEKKKQKAKNTEPAPTVIKSPRRSLTSFCALCRKRLTPSENIREHMQQEHSRYQCETCDRSFKSAMNLARHQHCHGETGSSTTRAAKSVSPKTPKAPETDLHKCSFCGRIFQRSNHLKLHLNRHIRGVSRAPVESPSRGSGLRARASLNLAMDGKANVTRGKAKKPEVTIRKSAIVRKTRNVS